MHEIFEECKTAGISISGETVPILRIYSPIYAQKVKYSTFHRKIIIYYY